MNAMHHPNRQSIRLKNYDYGSGGVFFITVCTHERRSLFGQCTNGVMYLNPAGRKIDTLWQCLPDHNPGLILDRHIVMPNHFHALFALSDTPGTVALSDLVRKFKTIAMHHYKTGVLQGGWLPYNRKLWQRSFWDHVIRNARDMDIHREYIANNPLKWNLDSLNPDLH